MLTTILLVTALGGRPGPATPVARATFDRPRVEVWTNRGDDPFHSGEAARVYVRADQDAYVALFRVDTDGRVRVLFPRDPWDDDFVRAGRQFAVERGRDDDAFEIDDYPGVGYIFAVSSADPFDFDPITNGDRWDYRVIADGRVRGDPYVALTDLAEQIVPSGDTDWDYDIAPYYVEQRYEYPRFLCYDCHSYATFSTWNPYAYSCVRFRIVVFDDPYYYPYRYYGGRRVVFTRPLRPDPRFIFKDRNGVGDDGFVTRERARPVNDNGRRGVRGADLGGRGSIPVPDVIRRPWRNRPDGDDGRRERPRSEDPRDRGDRGDHRDQPDAGRENPARRPGGEDQGRPEQRPRIGDERRQPPQERPDPPARREDERRDRGQDGRGNPRDRSQDRPPADAHGQSPAPRDAPRTEPRRGRDPAPSRGKQDPKPELRRRRP
jgi:uncharacterized protein DUF4384